MVSARAARPVVAYGTAASPRPNPPVSLRLLAVSSIAIAAATIALCAWSATRAYFTAPPGRAVMRSVAYTPIHRSPPPRVTVAQGNAILDGVAKVIPLTDKRRGMLQEALLKAEGLIEVETGPNPTADKIAAAATDSGPLFGEDGNYAVIGQVRIEVTSDRALIAGLPRNWPQMEMRGGSLTSAHYDTSYTSSSCKWSFLPPAPPSSQPAAATPPPPPPPPPTLLKQLRDVAPRLPVYGDAIVSALLAIVLLIAGIALLGYRPRGRRLHLVWAWIKLPLALAAAAAYFWMNMDGKLELAKGVTPLTRWVLEHPEFVTSALVALYALMLIIVLNLPFVRGYFREVRAAPLL